MHLYLVIIIYYARIKVHFHSSLSTFLTMKVQLYPPLSTIFICKCPVLLTNVHFFKHKVQFYSTMSTFLFTNVQFYILIKKLDTKNIQFHSSLCALSSIKINFSQLIPALFIFKSLTKYNKNSKQKFLLASSSYIFIIL